MTISTNKLYMSFSAKFAGIRCIDRVLNNVTWTINADLVAGIGEEEANGKDDDELSGMAAIKWQVVTFWAKQLLDNMLVYGVDDDWAKSVVFNTNNQIITVPGAATDDVLLQVLFEKINTICDGHLKLIKLSLTSSDIDATYTMVETGEASLMPGIEYVGENVKTHYTKPWWKRPTSQCFDLPIYEENQDNITQLHNDEDDFLIEFENKIAYPNREYEILFTEESELDEELKSEEVENNVIEPPWKEK